MSYVCKQEDDFVFEKPRWIAHLSNGEKVIQDDDRPGVEPAQAWLRLAEYCKQENISISNVTLQFRSHHEAPLPANANGYYFRNGIAAISGGPRISYFVVGWLCENKIKVQKWKIPELILMETEDRDIIEDDNSLIRRING